MSASSQDFRFAACQATLPPSACAAIGKACPRAGWSNKVTDPLSTEVLPLHRDRVTLLHLASESIS